jgi:hypothetical protein
MLVKLIFKLNFALIKFLIKSIKLIKILINPLNLFNSFDLGQIVFRI